MEQKTFSIKASTYTLKYNEQEGNKTILGNGNKYVVPIYQRPYSWTNEQINKFVSDIFISFWGSDVNSSEEPMFIGTLQMSEKNEIIDGQQRLSTFLILLKVLKHKFPNNELLKEISLDWLSTKVNNGTQQNYLEELLFAESFTTETTNSYLKNANLINGLIEEQNAKEEDNDFDVEKFVKYLLSNIYFVVIETKAGLSKTLQIFNAINTTGLDLNGGDIFKIRMYEYLTRIKEKDEKVFDEISNLYGKVEQYNKELGWFLSINDILSIYQYIIVAKYNLPVVLYHYGTDRFFEELFDTIFKITEREHFKNNVKKVDLSLDDIERIIEIRVNWEKNWRKKDNFTAEDVCSIYFIWWSRYSKYWLLTFVFLFKYNDWDKMLIFNRQLNRLFFIYSVRFQRLKSDIYYGAMQSVVETVVNKTFDETLSLINQYIGDETTNNPNWYDLNWFISENLVENNKRKNLICRMSAMLEENYTTTNVEEINKIQVNLWGSSIDIEHIQSYLDSNGDKREEILKDWGDDINSLGNLMVLEENINRSIGNKPYDQKLPRYKESIYKIVRLQVNDYPLWNINKCKERKRQEMRKILNYLFENKQIN